MIIPNYVPEPLEVPGNVADESYFHRLAFIRRVSVMHFASTAAVGALAFLPWPQIRLSYVLAGLATVLTGLEIWRIRRRGQPEEARVSAALLPLPLALAGWAAHEASARGWPVGAPYFGLTAGVGYTLLCGRDFSFVGASALALIVSSVALAFYSLRAGNSAAQAALALTLNAAYLIYFEYDLASLLSRRRMGEEWAALTDLYRDVFNFFGYAVRLVRHWHKHRIWV